MEPLNYIEDDQQNSNFIGKGWLYTFTDLVSLMLAFFVLLFSMSNVVMEEWEAVTNALSKSLKPSVESVKSKEGADKSVSGGEAVKSINLDYLSTILESKMLESDILKNNVIQHLGDRMVISLPSDGLFSTGSASPSQAGQTSLSEMGSILRNFGNVITVIGHTDTEVVRGKLFSSNWELSIARAVAVANELRRSGYPKEINAFGAADSHSSYISIDLPDDKRKALSRRVDIVIHDRESP
ncbi:MAG: flagellar motor protein MotB [Rhodospirillaceae bacterium]|jgi:chemotaxis protein MotB|nr:flagellar motor protein MotB [Rhodospirillaceae bacterium]MBT5373071.1 flagellar motor protein MotB [Rhodospirillaceae bacterium]MBT5659671.1 flagellar motor protein MotB [Rhodospirillaceae bacterium]MBT5752795.1 flagellar motor protein MotB [Rhodospirillaceae bacterium]